MLPTFKVLHGDCRQVMAKARDNGIDAIVTDPPYELGFMGKGWDKSGIAYDPEVWKQALRVLKPGGLLLAFGGTRTYHRMACAIEDAGFTVRDCLQWIYGSGFPKALDIPKAIDKAAGHIIDPFGYEPITDTAKEWVGWATSLKPAYEPIILAQKPLEGTYASNVTKWGVGGLNIAGSRIGSDEKLVRPAILREGYDTINGGLGAGTQVEPGGRWPANVLLDEAAAEMLDAQSGVSKSPGKVTRGGRRSQAYGLGRQDNVPAPSDEGGASRFFYVAKASRADRDYGCDDRQIVAAGEMVDRDEGSAGINNPRAGAGRTGGARNFHPTVKPLTLMRYLVRMITPPGGTVLDPFAGSGSTGVGAVLEGFSWVGIELTDDYLPIIRARVGRAYADTYPVAEAAD